MDIVMNDTVEFINDLDGIKFLEEAHDTRD
jgi:hypothetical protein